MKDEYDFIQQIRPDETFQSDLVEGIGDDAAIVKQNDQFEQVICQDTMVEGIHFRKDTMASDHIGYKALAANISDVAAMGAIPQFYLVSIAVPKENWSDEEVYHLFNGMKRLGDRFSMDLIGGDTVSSSSDLMLTVTVIGKVERGYALRRSNAQVGDIVFVTGYLGESAAGLSLLMSHGLDNHTYTQSEKRLIEKHQTPSPQVAIGRLLAELRIEASLNDISDGIATEANEIMEASDVAIEIDYDKMPRSEAFCDIVPSEAKQADYVLFGGEEFELIGTVRAADWPPFKEACERNQLPITPIGQVIQGKPAVYLKQGSRYQRLTKQGYNHFAE